MSRHLTDDDLINVLYEADEKTPHLDECLSCHARWVHLLERRQVLLAGQAAPDELLAEQRRRIYERIDQGGAWGWTLRPSAALVALGVMVLAVVISGPKPTPTVTTVASNDSQLFEEIYSMVESNAPSPVEPIYGLFEEPQ